MKNNKILLLMGLILLIIGSYNQVQAMNEQKVNEPRKLHVSQSNINQIKQLRMEIFDMLDKNKFDYWAEQQGLLSNNAKEILHALLRLKDVLYNNHIEGVEQYFGSPADISKRSQQIYQLYEVANTLINKIKKLYNLIKNTYKLADMPNI